MRVVTEWAQTSSLIMRYTQLVLKRWSSSPSVSSTSCLTCPSTPSRLCLSRLVRQSKAFLVASDVHALRDAPAEAGDLRHLFSAESFDASAIAGAEEREQVLVLSRRALLERHVHAPVAGRKRDHVLDARFEGRCAQSKIASAGSAEPVHGVHLEIVEHGFREVLPGVIEINSLRNRAALAGTVEAEHGPTVIGERLEERIKLFNERIVAAVKNKRGEFFAFSGETKAREITVGVWNLVMLVALNTFHGERVIFGEGGVESIANRAGGEIELGIVIEGSGISPALLLLGCLRGFKPDGGPAVEVFDLGGKCTSLGNAARGFAVIQRTVHGVVHAELRQDMQISHGISLADEVCS